MHEEKRRIAMAALKLFDLGLVVLSFGLTTLVMVHAEGRITFSDFFTMRTRVSNFVIFLLVLFLCHLVLSVSGLYRSRRLSSRRAELVDVAKGATLLVLCFVAVGSAFNLRMITLRFLGLFWVIILCAMCSAHLALRIALHQMRLRGSNLRNILILGTNPRAVGFARRIAVRPERGYQLLGFVDDSWPGLAQFEKSGFELVCGYADLAEYLRRNVVDEVAIYLPFGSFYAYSSEVAELCEQHGITMRFNSDLFGLKGSHWRAEEFDGHHYLATYIGPATIWPLAAKRALDVAVSSALLTLLSPTFLVVAALIKLTSHGPVFFLQERIGRNKRRFNVYKFRTMVPNAEKLMAKLEALNEASGPVFKIRNDPRITRIGKFLRRSSMDELPQLLNVLKGDMSLVGPRPLPVRDYEGFSEDWQRRRFSVKPGITCLWQVNGRSDISFEEWMLLDLEYMDEWSFWLDLKILAKTVPAVLRGEGAA